MRLLVDEDAQARTLVRLLQEAGHDVLTAEAAGLQSLADREVLARAVEQGRVLLTRNCGDFPALHCESRAHPGILAIYQGADPVKNMGYAAVVRSVANLVCAEVPLAGQFVVLNAWNW